MHTRPVLSALVASAIFAIISLAIQVTATMFLLSNTTTVVRYVGDANGERLYAIFAENSSWRSSPRIQLSIISAVTPTVASSSDAQIRLSRGGRGGESTLEIGTLDPGERRAILLAFPSNSSLPQMGATTPFGSKVVKDDQSLSVSLESVLWSLSGSVLVYLIFSYFVAAQMEKSNKRIQKLDEDIESVRHERNATAESLQQQVDKTRSEVLNQVAVLKRQAVRVRLIYERRIEYLLRENTFWRRLGRDIFMAKAKTVGSAEQMLSALLTRIGATPEFSSGFMTDVELLNFLEEDRKLD